MTEKNTKKQQYKHVIQKWGNKFHEQLVETNVSSGEKNDGGIECGTGHCVSAQVLLKSEYMYFSDKNLNYEKADG